MRLSLIILAVIGLAAASPLSGQETPTLLTASNASVRNNLIDQIVVALEDSLRSAIVSGSTFTPPLDPYQKDHHYIAGILLGQPGSFLEVKDVYATGLASFILEEINVEMTSLLLQWYRADLKFVVPKIEGSVGNYDTRYIAWNTLIWGNGEATIKITNAKLAGFLNFSVTARLGGIYLNIFNCQLNLTADDIEAIVTGLFDNEVSSEHASELVSATLLMILDVFQNEVSNAVSQVIKDGLNLILLDLNIADLLTAAAARV